MAVVRKQNKREFDDKENVQGEDFPGPRTLHMRPACMHKLGTAKEGRRRGGRQGELCPASL